MRRSTPRTVAPPDGGVGTGDTARTRAKRSRARKTPWVFLVLGLLLLAWPSVAEWWAVRGTTVTITSFRGEELTPEQRAARDRAIAAYQESLDQGRFNTASDPFTRDGVAPASNTYLAAGEVLFVLHIPSIGVKLPVHYGTDPIVLGTGAGLLENTSYPGHQGGHAVVSAHRGGHTQKFFLHLDRMQPGDAVYLEEKDRVLKYVMTGEQLVLPHETDAIKQEPGHDLLTLLTCDPPPVNDHRLLVRAERAAITDAEVAAINPGLVPPTATSPDAPRTPAVDAPTPGTRVDLMTLVLTTWWLPLAVSVGLAVAVLLFVLIPARRRRRALP